MEQSRKTWLSFVLAGITLSVASCSSVSVQTAKDPKADLAKYSTYAWAPEVLSSSGTRPASVLDETLKQTAEQELTAKGLQKVPPSQADLLISYHAKDTQKVSYGASAYPYPYWGGPPATYVTKEGNLTLQFIDPKMNQTVWQGTASGAIGDAGPSQEEVASAVKDIIEKYPKA